MSVLQVGAWKKTAWRVNSFYSKAQLFFVQLFGYSKAFLKAPNGLMMNWRNVDLLGLEKGYRLLGKILFEALHIHLLGMKTSPPQKKLLKSQACLQFGKFPSNNILDFWAPTNCNIPAYLQHCFVCSEGKSQQKRQFVLWFVSSI